MGRQLTAFQMLSMLIAQQSVCAAAPGSRFQVVAQWIFQMEKFGFLCSTNIKLSRQIRRNAIGACDCVLKFVISLVAIVTACSKCKKPNHATHNNVFSILITQHAFKQVCSLQNCRR